MITLGGDRNRRPVPRPRAYRRRSRGLPAAREDPVHERGVLEPDLPVDGERVPERVGGDAEESGADGRVNHCVPAHGFIDSAGDAQGRRAQLPPRPRAHHRRRARACTTPTSRSRMQRRQRRLRALRRLDAALPNNAAGALKRVYLQLDGQLGNQSNHSSRTRRRAAPLSAPPVRAPGSRPPRQPYRWHVD